MSDPQEGKQTDKENREERPEVIRWKTIILFAAGLILGLLSAFLLRR